MPATTLLLLLGTALGPLPASAPSDPGPDLDPRLTAGPRPSPQDEGPFVCPPCGGECDRASHDAPGSCASCGMELVPRATVPQVAVLLVPRMDVLAFTAPAGVFEATHAMNVFTVADTKDPILCRGFLEVVPRYDVTDAPPCDVLVLPPLGPQVLNDEYVMGWVARTAERARHVLAVGTGAIAAARALDLEEVTLAVPAFPFYEQLAQEHAPTATLSDQLPLRAAGKLLSARDPMASFAGALELVERLAGRERVDAVLRRLGPALAEPAR